MAEGPGRISVDFTPHSSKGSRLHRRRTKRAPTYFVGAGEVGGFVQLYLSTGAFITGDVL